MGGGHSRIQPNNRQMSGEERLAHAREAAVAGEVLARAKQEARAILKKAQAEAVTTLAAAQTKAADEGGGRPILREYSVAKGPTAAAALADVEALKRAAISDAKAQAAEDIQAFLADMPSAAAALAPPPKRAPPKLPPGLARPAVLPPLTASPSRPASTYGIAADLGGPDFESSAPTPPSAVVIAIDGTTPSGADPLEAAVGALKTAMAGLLAMAKAEATALLAAAKRAAAAAPPSDSDAAAAAAARAAAAAEVAALKRRLMDESKAAEVDIAARRKAADEALLAAQAEAAAAVAKGQAEAAAAMAAAAAAAAASAPPSASRPDGTARFQSLISALTDNAGTGGVPDVVPLADVVSTTGMLGDGDARTLGTALGRDRTLSSLDCRAVSLSLVALESICTGLARHPTVATLILGDVALPTAASAASLLSLVASSSTLRTLDVSSAAIDPVVAMAVAAAPGGLQSLCLPTGSDGWTVLPVFADAARLFSASSRRVSLSTAMSPTDVDAAIADATTSLSRDADDNTYRSMAGWGASVPVLRPLLAAVGASRCLSTLDLSGNPLGREGAELVATLLASPGLPLVVLRLQKCGLDAPGAIAALAAGLPQCVTLTQLELDANALGASEVAALAPRAGGLTWLQLDGNPVGDAGASALSSLVRSSPSLVTLSLVDASLTAAGVGTLAAALEAAGPSSKLTTLDVTGCPGAKGPAASTLRTLLLWAMARAVAASMGTVPSKVDELPRLIARLWSDGASYAERCDGWELHDGEARSLAEAVEGATSLRSLSFDSAVMTAADAATLAAALAKNSGLTQLSLAGACPGTDHVRAVAKVLLAANATLTSLSLARNALSAEAIRLLANALEAGGVGLTSLDLSLCNIGNEGADRIASAVGACPSLTTVTMDGNPGEVSDGAARLSAACARNAAGPAAVRRASALSDLLESLNAGSITYCYSLSASGVTLSLDDAAKLADALAANASLVELSLYATALPAAAAGLLCQALLVNSALRELRVDSNPALGDAGAAAFAALLRGDCGLTLLDLECDNITSAGAALLAESLACNTTLTVLRLRGNPCDGTAAVNEIKALLARNASFAECAANASSKADRLAGIGATDTSISLRCLQLSRKETRAAAKALGATTALQSLDCSGNPLGAEGIKALGLPALLSSSVTLTSLTLDGCLLGPQGLATLLPGVTASRGLTSLSLGRNGLGGNDVDDLAAAVAAHPSLTSLGMDSNAGLGDDGATALARAVGASAVLKTLDLTCCSIGPRGMAAIAAAVRRNPKSVLASVYAWGGLGYSSAASRDLDAAMAKATAAAYKAYSGAAASEAAKRLLSADSTDDSLYLSWNGFNPADVGVIASALGHNTACTSLYLSYNRDMCDGGAQALAGALGVNSSLKRLEVPCCGITEAGMASLARALDFNTALTALSVYGNPAEAGPAASSIVVSLARNARLADVAAASSSKPALFASLLDGLRTGLADTTIAAGSWGLTAGEVIRLAAALDSPGGKCALSVDLTGAKVSGQPMRALGAVLASSTPVLTTLVLSACGLTGTDATAVGDACAAPSLTSLDLSANGLDDKTAWAALGHATKLTTLSLADNPGLGPASALASFLRDGARLPSLTSLSLDGCGLGAAGMAAIVASLESRTALTSLSLLRNGADPARLPSLRRAEAIVARNAAAAAAVASAAAIAAVIDAVASGTDSVGPVVGAGAGVAWTPTQVAALATALRGSATSRLDLSGTPMDAAALAPIAAAIGVPGGAMRALILDGCPGLDSAAAAALASGALVVGGGLTALSLCNTAIGAAGAAAFETALRDPKRAPRLTSLVMYNTPAEAAPAARSVARLLEARSDAVSRESMAPRLAQSVKDLVDNLRQGWMWGAYVGAWGLGPTELDDVFEAVAATSSLRYLQLTGNTLGEAGARSLAEVLRRSRTLETVDCSRAGLGGGGFAVSVLARALATSSVVTISLAANDLGADAIDALRRALVGNTVLLSLNVADNPFGDDGAGYLAALLAGGSPLTSLDASACGITSSGVAALAAALESPSAVTGSALGSLSLEGNPGASSAAARRLPPLLTRGTSVAETNRRTKAMDVVVAALESGTAGPVYDALSWSPLTAEDVSRLAAALKLNTSVTTLCLQACGLTGESIAPLMDALANPGPTLAVRTIHLSYNSLGDAGAAALAACLASPGCKLTEIHVDGCSIGIVGAAALAAAVGAMPAGLSSSSTVDGNTDCAGTPEGASLTLALMMAGHTREQAARAPTKAADLAALMASLGAGTAGPVVDARCWALTSEETRQLAVVLASSPGVETVDLRGNGFGPLEVRSLAAAITRSPSITAVDLSGNAKVGSAGAWDLARAVAANPNLASLTLDGCGIGTDGIASLAEAVASSTGLAVLSLVGNPGAVDATSPAMASLVDPLARNAAAAERRRITKLVGTVGGALRAGDMTYCSDFWAVSLSDADVESLASSVALSPSLTTLCLYNASIGPAGAASLASMLRRTTVLEELRMDSNAVGDAGCVALAEALAVNSSLRRLDLESNGNITADGAAAFLKVLRAPACPSTLESLSLSWGNPCDGSPVLADLETVLAANRAANNARRVSLVVTTLVAQLAANTITTSAELCYCACSEADFGRLGSALATNTSLSSLCLYYTGCGDAGARCLASALEVNTTLVELRMDSNPGVGAAGCAALGRALATNRGLHLLDLEYCGLTADNAVSLLQGLKANNSLTSLRLGGNPCEASAAAVAIKDILARNAASVAAAEAAAVTAAVADVAARLRANTIVEWTAVTIHSLSMAHVEVLASALRGNTSLVTLYLPAADLEREEAACLAAVLPQCAVADLLLDSNDIGASGAAALGAALKSPGCKLTRLSLEKCGLGLGGAGALLDGLASNTTLTSLSLDSCSLGDDGAALLGAALATNGSLTSLDIDGTGITATGFSTLLSKLKAAKASALKEVSATGCPGSYSDAAKELTDLVTAKAQPEGYKAKAPPPPLPPAPVVPAAAAEASKVDGAVAPPTDGNVKVVDAKAADDGAPKKLVPGAPAGPPEGAAAGGPGATAK